MPEKFNPQSIAIATITSYPNWYRGKLKSIKHTDKVRGDLALEFLKKAISKKFQTVVVEGKSTKTFKKELANLKGLTVSFRRSQKRSPARRQAFKIASKLTGIKAIVSTEPEKVALLDFMEQISSPVLNASAEIVVPKREIKLFESTYPKYMFESETEGQRIYNQFLITNNLLKEDGADLDLFFGPRVFKNDQKVVSLFMKKFHLKIEDKIIPKELFDTEEYSNTQYFPVILALKKKLRVLSVKIPFSYPKLQKENEEIGAREVFIEKRKNQRLSLILELVHFLNLIKKR